LKNRNDVLDQKAVLVSEVLQEAGYTTFGVFSNPHLRAGSGFDQGWDRFHPTAGWKEVSSERVNREFYRWRKKRTEPGPYFALLWYIDPHTPFQWDKSAATWAGVSPAETFLHKPEPKDESAPQSVRMRAGRHYEASVRSVDNTLSGLVRFLREQGDYDDALIVFTGDHGESLWEHGRFGHNYGLYDHLTHVPLLMRLPSPLHFPDFAPWTGRSASIASSVDVLPTTLDFLGMTPGDTMQGRSLLPELVTPTGGTAYLEQRLTHYGPYEIFGMREGRFKYIWIEQFEGNNTPRALLFDLESDPMERKNLASERPELAAEFHARTMERRRSYESIALNAGTAEVDARTRTLLDQLGYVEEQRAEEPPAAP
jgi:arylsulfatase A-like enzyme